MRTISGDTYNTCKTPFPEAKMSCAFVNCFCSERCGQVTPQMRASWTSNLVCSSSFCFSCFWSLMPPRRASSHSLARSSMELFAIRKLLCRVKTNVSPRRTCTIMSNASASARTEEVHPHSSHDFDEPTDSLNDQVVSLVDDLRERAPWPHDVGTVEIRGGRPTFTRERPERKNEVPPTQLSLSMSSTWNTINVLIRLEQTSTCFSAPRIP